MLDAPSQLDLLDWSASQARPLFPPPRPIEWEELVGRTIAAGHLWIHTSRRWTGVVVEQLVAPDLGKRWILWRDRRGYLITSYPAVNDATPHRTVFVSPQQLYDLHAVLPLIQLEIGDGWARYRPCEAGEVGPTTLDIPT